MAMEFQFGDWLVSPESNIVSNGDAKTQLEPRVMAVLRYLCRHPGAVIPAEEILQACWGSNELGDNPVHKAITQLRRAFGDSSTEPRYIETIRKRGYRAIAPVVTLASPAPATWEGGSPFRGLEAFQENHAAIFFGRVQATAQLRELAMTQAAHGCPMALVLGPSGSGKTSLVRAGLLPQLMAAATRSDEPIGLVSTVYLDCADLGSGTLFQALAGVLIDADINGEPLFPGASADSLGQRLATDPDAVAAELSDRACSRTQIGVFVDRLEAAFRAEPNEVARFFGAIDALSKSNCLQMLMACRNDFYPEVMAQPVLLALKTRGGHFDVFPPDGADIAQIVRQPALAARLKFQQDKATGANLDDVLCDAARENHDMLPLLQYTLNELYRQRDENGLLQFDVYHQLGGIEGAVGVRAEQVVDNLTASQLSALPHVLSLLVNVGENQTAVTSRRSPFNMLRTDDERELVRVMIEARLFVSELSGDVPSFGVAHEALLRRWKRVSDWIDLFRDALQLRTRLDGQAERWATAKRPGDLLLPKGSQVDKAVELLKQDDIALSPAIQEYVQASLRRAKRGERIRLSVTALIALLAILTGIFGLGARSAQKEADQRRIDAEDLMTFMLGDLAEKLRPMGKLEILDNISAKSLAYLSRPQPQESSKVALFQKAKALHMIAEVDISRSKRSEAASALSAARMLLQQASLILPSDRQFLRELGLNSFLSGQIYFYENKLDQAEQQMRQYLDYSSQFAATDPADLEGMVQKSRAHTSVGTLALRRGDNQAAGKEFANSMVLKRQLLAKTPGDETLSVDLANTVSWLAETKVNTGQLHEAMQLYRQEEELLRPLYSKNATWTSRIALSKWRQALLNIAFGQPEAARSDLQEAHRLMQKIVNDEPTNSAWRLRLYMVDLRLLEVAGGRTSPADSLKRLESLYSALNELSEHEPPNKQLALQIAKSQYLVGDVLLALGKRDMAINKFDSAIASISGLDKDEIQAGFLAEALLKRARAAKESPDMAAHRAFCTQARDVLSPYLSKQAHYSMVALQFEANTCLGDFDALVPLRQQLDQMYYREGQYLRLLTSLSTQKGKPQ